MGLSLLEYLRGGPAGISSWNALPQAEKEKVFYSYVELHRKEADLSGAKLAGIDLTGIFLRGACFDEADMSDAKLMRSQVDRVSFRGTHLVRADFSQASQVAGGTDFTGANLTGASLSDTDLRNCIFENTDLSKANLRNACMQGVNLSTCNVIDASFLYTRYNEATKLPPEFSQSQWSEMNWQGACPRLKSEAQQNKLIQASKSVVPSIYRLDTSIEAASPPP